MIALYNKIPRINNILPLKTLPVNRYSNNTFCDEFVSTVSFKSIQHCKNGKIDRTYCIEDVKICPQYKTAINETAEVSKTLKERYDEKYGENNWEYTSIGRSCELIAKALEMQGVKTHIIPISGLSYYTEGSKGLTEQKGFPAYRQYIYDKGLTPDNINDSGKKFIFQDYRNSGRSMKLFEEFIKSEEFGYDGKNIVFESINDALSESKKELEEKGVDADSFIMNRLTLDNNPYSFKYFLSSRRFPCEDLGAISAYEKNKPEEKTEEKIFKNGLLKLLKP